MSRDTEQDIVARVQARKDELLRKDAEESRCGFCERLGGEHWSDCPTNDVDPADVPRAGE